MRMRVKFVWAAGVSVLAVALALGTGNAALDDEANAAVNAIADKLEKGDAAGAKKDATELAKNDLDSIMHAFKLKKQKGIGLLKLKDTTIPDGVELAINGIADGKVSAAAIKKETAALTRAGYVSQAIALVAVAKAPDKDDGKKKVSDWKEWSSNMVAASQEFTNAAKAGDAAALKKAANKLKNSCDSCHPLFK
jgi:hypothetical protein